MILAASAPAPSAWDQPGTIAFLIVFGMCVVMYFVFRSMAKHLRKVNEAARLEAEQAAGTAAGADLAGRLPGGKDGAAQA
jgi:cbb3-type cytochrome oxidase subunit 3